LCNSISAKEKEKAMKKSGNGFGHSANRRTFLKKGMMVAGATTVGAGLLGKGLSAFGQEDSGRLTRGDAAILRFLAAAEILESDLWQQYAELGGVTPNDLGFTAGGSPLYVAALQNLDGDMPQYITDNTDDEFSHFKFINAYLVSKGAKPVNLDRFRTLPSSKATGAQRIGRLTNLMQLTVDTSWWTRYRSDSKNPDFGDAFDQAVPSLHAGQHPAIPTSDADLAGSQFNGNNPPTISNHLQAIANTAGFHFAFIEQGGSSLYPSLAQRVSSVEVLRILLSIGPTETSHFQTWHDKAGNAPPVTDGALSFPDLKTPPQPESLQGNLIMPEPTIFLDRKFPVCSIIRPTETEGVAMGAVKGLTADGLFIGQSPEFFEVLRELAEEADEARSER
jgi:hypothetical protein